MAENDPNLHPNLIQNGNILAHQYEIVRRMLRYLPMRDLLTCCQVDQSPLLSHNLLAL